MKNIYYYLLVFTVVLSFVSCSKENIQPNAYKSAVSNNSQLVEVNPQSPVMPSCPHSCSGAPCGNDVE